jgi:hypothetical protein
MVNTCRLAPFQCVRVYRVSKGKRPLINLGNRRRVVSFTLRPIYSRKINMVGVTCKNTRFHGGHVIKFSMRCVLFLKKKVQTLDSSCKIKSRSAVMRKWPAVECVKAKVSLKVYDGNKLKYMKCSCGRQLKKFKRN